MKYLLISIFCLLSVFGFSQSTLPIRADTVLIEKSGGNGELKIKNSTRDSLGILVNMGGGRTRFIRVRQITDSSFIIPPGGVGDTIVIRGTGGGNQNFANTDLTLTGNRIHSFGTNSMKFNFTGLGPNGDGYVSFNEDNLPGLTIQGDGDLLAPSLVFKDLAAPLATSSISSFYGTIQLESLVGTNRGFGRIGNNFSGFGSINGSQFTSEINVHNEGNTGLERAILVRDSIYGIGMHYSSDYKTLGLLNFGNRWIPDYGAVLDAISAGGGLPSLPTGRLWFGDASNSAVTSDSLQYDRVDRTLKINKGSTDSPAIRIHQSGSTAFRPWLQVDAPQANDSTSVFQFASSQNANDDGSKSNHVVKWGFNMFNQNANNARLYRSMESNWFSGGLRYLEDILEVQLKNGATTRLQMHTFTGGENLASSNNVIDFRGSSISLKSLDDATDRWSVGPGIMQLFSSGLGYSQFQMMAGSATAEFENNGTDLIYSGAPFNVQGNLNLYTSILGNTERAGLRLIDNEGGQGFLINHGSAYGVSKYRKAVMLLGSNGAAYESVFSVFNDLRILIGNVVDYDLSPDQINMAGVTHFLDNIKADSFATGSSSDAAIVWNSTDKEFKTVSQGMANPMTTAGDIIVGGASGVPTRKAIGTSNQVLGVDNAGTGNEYKTLTGSASVGVAHSAGAVTFSVPTSYITAADYVPTLTGIANVDAVVLIDAHYMRINDQVSVDIALTIDPTVITTTTNVDITLPIASTMTNFTNLTGIITSGDGAIGNVVSVSNIARVGFSSTATSSTTYNVHFMYKIQ